MAHPCSRIIGAYPQITPSNYINQSPPQLRIGRLDRSEGIAIVNRMVNKRDPLSIVFSALADPTRRGMLAHLAQGTATVGELGAPYAISKPAVTKHLRVLESAGLVVRRKDGRVHRCRLEAEPLDTAQEWIETQRRFWEIQLDSLARYLEETQEGEES